MARRRLLTLDLLALAFVLLVGPVFHGFAIQSDLRSEARDRLARAGLESVGVLADGRDLELTGEVATAQHKMEAERVVASLPGVRSIADRLMLAPPTPPPLAPSRQPWVELRLAPHSTLIRGLLPDDLTRKELLAVVRAVAEVPRDLEVEVEVGIDVAPAPWVTSLKPCLVFLDDQVEDAYLRVGGGTVVLGGWVADRASRKMMGQVAASALRGTEVQNELEVLHPSYRGPTVADADEEGSDG